MSLKLSFVDSHLNFFPDKVSDEHGEIFYQEISDIERISIMFVNV